MFKNHSDTVVVWSLSHFLLFAAPWTVAPSQFLCPRDLPGKSSRVGCRLLACPHSCTGTFLIRVGCHLLACPHSCTGTFISQPPGRPILIELWSFFGGVVFFFNCLFIIYSNFLSFYPFVYDGRVPFHIFCKVGLVMMNSISFHISGKAFLHNI